MAGRITLRMLARGKQDFALGECLCAAFMWVREWGAGVVRQSEWWVNGDSCVIGVMVDGNVWVQCMMGNVVHGWCAVWVSGNQIHNTYSIHSGYLLFFETTIMGNTADLAVVQKTIIDTLHKEDKSQRVITETGVYSRSAVSKNIKCKVDWEEEIG